MNVTQLMLTVFFLENRKKTTRMQQDKLDTFK